MAAGKFSKEKIMITLLVAAMLTASSPYQQPKETLPEMPEQYAVLDTEEAPRANRRERRAGKKRASRSRY